MRKDGSRRVWGYGLAAWALLSVFLLGPRAWATPVQLPRAQTVPSATPVVVWSSPTPVIVPPTSPPATATPAATVAPANPFGTPEPPPSPTSSATSLADSGAALTLVNEAAQRETWPGATLHFILRLTNVGTASARQVTLEDVLPDGLEPGAVQGGAAAWDGRTLRASVALLPPGGRLEVAFSAAVRRDIAAGGLLVNRARATAAGGLSVSAETFVVLPPAELPVVGGDWRALHCAR